MQRFLRMVLAAVLGGALAGCVESNDAYTVNPDGSGKVVRMMIVQPSPDLGGEMSINGAKASPKAKASPAEMAKEVARAELEKSEGVDTWKDVKAYLAKDGRICFQGTAYFKDLNKLKLHNNGFSSGGLTPAWSKNAKGQYVLAVKFGKFEEVTPAAKPAPKAMSDAEVKAMVAEKRVNYQQGKGMMVMMLSSLKMTQHFRLPGAVTESHNFVKNKVGNPCVSLSGMKFLQVMDEMMADDAWMEAQVRAGTDMEKDSPPMDDTVNGKLFGQKGPVRLVVASAGAKPVFDYAAEVAAAKAAYPAIARQFAGTGKSSGTITLGRSAKGSATPLPPSTGGNFKSVTVEDVSVTRDSGRTKNKGFQPGRGCTVSVRGEFNGAVAFVEGGLLEKAMADNGENLLPEEEFWRQINFPRLAENNGEVSFDVKMKAPTAAAKSLKEVSGHLDYCLATGTAKVDLGFVQLTANAQGKKYEAEISTIKNENGLQQMILDLKISHAAIKGIELFDAAGKPLGAKIQGSSWGDDHTQLTVEFKGALPKNGRVMLEVYDNIRRFSAPFVLKNVELPK